MTTLTRSNPTSHPPVSPQSRLSLQVTRPGTSPRTIPLPMGKCTIGSSQRCQIRLPEELIQPLHCLIVRSPTETQITRWAPGALLNGQEFTSETIQPGDCVTLGDVQLQLVAQAEPNATARPTATVGPISPIAIESFLPAAPHRANWIATAPPAVTDEPTPVAIPSDSSQLEADRLVEQLRSANTIDPCAASEPRAPNGSPALTSEMLATGFNGCAALNNARQRCRGAIASLRDARAQSVQLNEQIVSLEELIDALRDESLQKTAQLQQRHGESVGQDQQSTAEIDRLTAEVVSVAQQLSEREATLDQLRTDCQQLQQEIESLQIERKRLTTTAAEQQQLYDELEETLAQRDEQIAEISAELQQSLSSLQALETVQDEQSDHAKQLRDELTALQSQQQQQLAELANSQAQQVELEQVLAKRDGQIAQLYTELAEAQQSLQQLERSGVDQVDANKLLEVQLTQLQTEKRDWLEEELQHHQQQFDLQQELVARDETIHDLSQQLATSHDHFGKLQQQLDDQLTIAQDFESEALELRSHSDQRINETAAQKQQRQQLEQLVEQQQQSLAALQHEAHSARDELDHSVQHVAQLEQHQVAADQHIADLQAELNGQSTAAAILQQEKEDLLARRDALSDQLEQTGQELESTCRELDRSQQESRDQHFHLASRATELAEASQEVDSLRAEKLALVQSVEEKELQIDQLRTDLDHAAKALQETQQARLRESVEPAVESPIPEEQLDLPHEQEASDNPSADTFSDEPAEHPSDQIGFSGNRKQALGEATERVESVCTSIDRSVEPPTEQQSEHSTAEAELDPQSPSAQQADKSAPPVPPVREESDSQEPTSEELTDEEQDQEESDEAALEAYMSNLMRRVRGNADSGVPTSPISAAIEPPSASLEPEVDTEYRQPIVSTTPRRHPKPIELTQLRTLANTSTRQAISSHRRRYYMEAATGKLIAGSFSLGTAGYLFSTATEFISPAFLGGAFAAIAGSHWVVQLGVMLMFARSGDSARAEAAGDPPAKTEQLPIDGQAETPAAF